MKPSDVWKIAGKIYRQGWWKTRADKEGQLKYMFIEGVRFADKWHSIDDRDNPIPNEGEVLIRLENGSIRRYDEEWSEEFGLDGIVTHWKMVNIIDEMDEEYD